MEPLFFGYRSLSDESRRHSLGGGDGVSSHINCCIYASQKEKWTHADESVDDAEVAEA